MGAIAIDLGSSNARLMFAEKHGSDYEITELARFPIAPKVCDEGYRWDVETLFAELRRALRTAAQNRKIEKIGICSWGVDYGLVAEGALFDMPYCYRDPRTEEVFRDFHTKCSAEKYYEKSGIYPSSINTIYQLLDDLQKGRIKEGDGKKLVLIADLFAWYLTGRLAAEQTNASTTGLLAADGKDWNFEFIKEIGLPRSVFPPLLFPGECYGEFEGIPVYAVCTHDTASSVEAMTTFGLSHETAFLSSGSWLLFGRLLESPITTSAALEAGFTNERARGNKVCFLKNINGLFVVQRLVAELGLDYKKIDEEMDNARVLGVLDTDKLMSLEGMRTKILTQLGLATQDALPYDLLKTVYFSLAARIAKAKEELELITEKKVNRIVMTGGATRAPYLCSEIVKQCGVELIKAKEEGAVNGILKVLFD